MSFKLTIMKKAEKDLEWYRKNSKSDHVKSFDLLRNTAQTPREGLGQPERLKHHEEEVWSRRVNQQDRMIYTIYEKEKEVDIAAFKGHYDD